MSGVHLLPQIGHQRTGRLLAVLATPPLTSGAITLGRIARAAEVLGASDWIAANLLNLPTASVLDIPNVGRERETWLASRPSLRAAIASSTAVLLAYGTAEPVGGARVHWRDQIEWVTSEIARNGCTVYTWGGAPRHPSRWQRYRPKGTDMQASYRSMLRRAAP
jgi:hypothetical protein